MTLPVTFANLAAGPELLSLFDTQFAAVGALTVIPCTATGTNSLALTPFSNTPTVSAYANYALYSFVAPNTTTGVLTVAVSGLNSKKVYLAGGTIQASTNDLVSGALYIIMYNSALDSATGGFVLIVNGGPSGSQGGIEFVINGGGSTILTGIAGDLIIPFNCNIQSVTMVADQSCSAVVNIWKCTYAQFDDSTHPVAGDKITASAPPTIASDVKTQDTTLTGWTKTITQYNVLRFNVDSNDNATQLSLVLGVTI